jgi:hypothetical protein
MAVSEAPTTRGPGGSELVARLSGPLELFAAIEPARVRCAGCAAELQAGEACFTMRRVGASRVPVCTSCEPLPPGSEVEWERVLHRECAHPRCAHTRLVSGVVRSGDSLERARLQWEHERALSTWGPDEPAHRPWLGRLLEG